MAPQLEPEHTPVSAAELAEMVAEAELPSLLAALAHVGERPGLLADDLVLQPAKHHEPQGGWTPEQQSHARRIALGALVELADAGWPAGPKPTAATVGPIMSWMMAT